MFWIIAVTSIRTRSTKYVTEVSHRRLHQQSPCRSRHCQRHILPFCAFIMTINIWHAQKKMHGKWVTQQPHCAFLHGVPEGQLHLINSRICGGASATSVGIGTSRSQDLKVSSRANPYSSGFVFGLWLKGSLPTCRLEMCMSNIFYICSVCLWQCL